MKKILVLALTTVLAGSIGVAQAAGSASAGKAKATTVCAACHGADGNSMLPNFPKLAGLDAGYILKQLKDFKSGARKGGDSALMMGQVAGLSVKEMEDLAAYFASQKPSAGTATGDKEQIKLAEHLYRGGNAKFGVPACMSCHGPSGQGIPPRFPRVSGQHAAYSEKQLLAFKAGERANDNNIMTQIAFRMSPAEIKAVADYMAGLHVAAQ